MKHTGRHLLQKERCALPGLLVINTAVTCPWAMHNKLKFHGLQSCSHSTEQTYNQFVFKSPRHTVLPGKLKMSSDEGVGNQN